MNEKLKEKILESLTSVLPITMIVFVLSVTAVPIPIDVTVMFLAGAFMLIVGMGFFSLGSEISMYPLGSGVGSQLGRMNVVLASVIAFVMGTIITIAEPDLQVLADQVPAIPDEILIATVALGVGLFLAIALLRIAFRISLSKILFVCYVAAFAIAALAPRSFIAVAFDSGGVTTGPMTVPFIMSLGVGLAATRATHRSQDDSFGLVSLCSVGPIIAVLLLGIAYDPQGAELVDPEKMMSVSTTRDVAERFLRAAPRYIVEVGRAILPIAACFALFQIITHRWKARALKSAAIGFVYTMIGLVLFLTGVNVGFIPVGHLLGSEIALSEYRWALLPLGALIGYYTVKAEPAVHVLDRQVEEVSGGAISQRAMRLSLSLGIALSLALSMLRILTGISLIWFIVPGYAIAILMSMRTPKIFTGIAFDSGGVASGPMTSTFILPFAMGACGSVGGDVLTDAFGVIALVAMTPLVTIQALGLIYARQTRTAAPAESLPVSDEIVDFEEDGSDG